MNSADTGPLTKEDKPDWRDKELNKKHAKLMEARRENEILRRLLLSSGLQVPDDITRNK